MSQARLWLKLGPSPWRVEARINNSRLVLDLDSAKGIGDATYLVCYPQHRRVYTTDRIYSNQDQWDDYAYHDLEQWLSDGVRGHSFTGKKRGETWGKVFPRHYETRPRKQSPQVAEMYKATEVIRQEQSGNMPFTEAVLRRQKQEQARKELQRELDKKHPPDEFPFGMFATTSSTTEDFPEPMNERVRLFTVAAIFYPELPEGAVLSKEEVEYPKLVLQPKSVLARNREEAQSRVAAKVEEGYLDRQDGHVKFVFAEYQ